MTTQLKINLTLFFLGLLGIIAVAVFPIPIEFPKELLERYSKTTLSLIILIQPVVLLIVAVLIGKRLAPKVGLSTPTIEGIIKGHFNQTLFKSQLITGSTLGLIAGLSLAIVTILCTPYLPQELLTISDATNISPIVRFLYGGITEEILVRWGFMSLFVWAAWKISSKKTTIPSPTIYWVGILLAAFIFGLGHLPATYNIVDDVTLFLICYIIISNMIFGIVAGWLFWKKGLEAAIIAHMFAHVGMIIIEQFQP